MAAVVAADGSARGGRASQRSWWGRSNSGSSLLGLGRGGGRFRGLRSLGQGTGRYVTGERKASEATSAWPSATALAGRRAITPQVAVGGGTARRRLPRPVRRKVRPAHLILVRKRGILSLHACNYTGVNSSVNNAGRKRTSSGSGAAAGSPTGDRPWFRRAKEREGRRDVPARVACSRSLEAIRQLPRSGSGSLLPRAGCVHEGGQARLQRVCRASGVPGVRTRERREVRYLGRHERA